MKEATSEKDFYVLELAHLLASHIATTLRVIIEHISERIETSHQHLMDYVDKCREPRSNDVTFEELCRQYAQYGDNIVRHALLTDAHVVQGWHRMYQLACKFATQTQQLPSYAVLKTEVTGGVTVI